MKKAAGLETLSPAMAQISNYFDWVYDTMLPFLGARVLEVGPGFGNLAERLRQPARAYYAIDSDAQVIETLHRRLALPEDHAVVGDITNALVAEKISSWRPDTLISMNVLEHIEDDERHLVSLMRLPSIQRLIFFVPALPILYGTMDAQAGHFRRYTRSGLSRLLARVGGRRIRVRYFNGLGAAAWWTAGRLFGCKTDSEKTNHSILHYDRYVIPAARFMDSVLSPFFGQSLLAYAETSAGDSDGKSRP